MSLTGYRFVLALGYGTVGAALGLLPFVGCGSSSSAGATVQDSGYDVSTQETGVDGPAVDGKQEASDAATSDSDAADVQSFDDVGDVAIDVPPLEQFPHAVDEAFCNRLHDCCAVVDGGTWNQDGDGGCVMLFDTNGGAFDIAGFNAALDAGGIAYDAAAAYNCLHEFLSFSCGTVAASALDAVRDTCFGAMQGTLASGQGPCVNSLQCQPGLYCASTSKCAPLQGQGQPCQDQVESTDCTYLGEGTPALFCSPAADGGPGATCQAALPVGSNCVYDQACLSGACAYPACSNTVVFSDPGVPNGICATFTE